MTNSIQDPTFPLIHTPIEFKPRRQTRFYILRDGLEFTLFEAEGAGCVRHLWITTGTSGRGIKIRIHVDDSPAPQVDMDLNRFFGILLDKDPYLVESPGVSVLSQIAYNCYMPIPFTTSCRITLYAEEMQGKLVPREKRLEAGKPEKAGLYCQVDWQQYKSVADLTPYRLHAYSRVENPARSKGSFLVGDLEGRGFVAGMFKGVRRLDKSDLLYHTGGSTWLIDGESEPNALRGYNEEDDFGFSFGLFNQQSRWVGAPVADVEGPFAEEFVAWRFFGPDPVPFDSSLRLDFGSRADHTESVLFYYKVLGTVAAPLISPVEWEIRAPFGCLNFDEFSREESDDEISAAPIQKRAESVRGWLDIRHLLRDQPELWQDLAKSYIALDPTYGSAADRLPVGFSVYARGSISSERDTTGLLRVAFDDWMTLWVNGAKISTIRHDKGFEIAHVPVSLKKGDNRIQIKLNNANNREYRLWAFNCAFVAG